MARFKYSDRLLKKLPHKIKQPKGIPVQEWKVFTQRHAGLLWLLYWGLPHLRLLLAGVFGGKMGSRTNN
ncbi:MAG: hypothetical protein F6K22_30620 [Okeania sp. SIO2F4]|uniref:hypothetical protein n=1 Tax=Okeania sp. SIO2F4 TaxID=2607790 RepID=UPI00142A4DE1|nr:hypothetical protein [Okeania sp. SIO2F4]NES06788.1 hypothetical protein [Okeania sp. SIO2F4]